MTEISLKIIYKNDLVQTNNRMGIYSRKNGKQGGGKRQTDEKDEFYTTFCTQLQEFSTEAVEEMWRIHQNVLRVNGYLGRPINYILTGIKEFSTAFSVDQHYIHEYQEISKNLSEKLLMAMDQLNNLEGRIEELRDNSILPIDVQEKVNAFLEECDEVRNKFYTSVRENLPKARLCDEDARDELLVTYGRLQDCSISEKKLQKFLEKYPIIEKAKWLSSLLKSSKIPVYVMADVEEAIRSSNNQIFVLFFSISDVPNEDNWKRMVETFVTAGKENDVRLFAVHVDSGLAETNTIVVWKDKKQLTNDYFGDMERTRAMNMAFPQSKFNQNKSDFTTTVYAEFPCPKKDCRGGKSLDWTCSQCVSVLQFDCKEDFVCECGSLPIDQFLFKCSGASHGEEKSAVTEEMKDDLSRLKPYPQKNILIIGESGVGKTTFINATACYTMFSSMEEAEKNELPCLIPFEFKMRINGEQHLIKMGDSENEVYEGTKSVTQFPKAHYFKTKDTIFCLIDTPGIGDCRGVAKDKENIQNVLEYLENFKEIHLICFVMEPDKCRLTEIFQYCFKELIMQFHRSVLKNLVFCFTKGSACFYQLGDTADALEVMFKEIQEQINKIKKDQTEVFSLKENETLFVVDNFAFRYLAMVSKGYSDPDRKKLYSEGYRISSEKIQIMMNRAKNFVPHCMEDSLHVNRARNTIISLNGPLIQIGQAVNKTVNEMEEQDEKIRKGSQTAEELERALYITIKLYRYRMVIETSNYCKECAVYQEFTGEERMKYIEADPSLAVRDPIVMLVKGKLEKDENGKEHCAKHGENVTVIQSGKTFYTEYFDEKKLDTNVEMQLKNAQSATERVEILKREKMLLMNELKAEEEAIKKASATFAIFLRDNTLTPYNDKTEAYLLLCMENLDRNGLAGTDKWRNLNEMLMAYRKEKECIQREIDNGNQGTIHSMKPAEIMKTVEVLRHLKHYGRYISFALTMRKVLGKENVLCITWYPELENVHIPHNNPSTVKSFFKSISNKNQQI